MTSGVSFGDIPVEDIAVGDRLRRIDPAWVEVLAASIETQGLAQPVSVVLEQGGFFTLLAGAHRLEAVRSLGWTAIPARIVEWEWMDAHERRISEIHENLIRHELTKLDRARSLSTLKVIHEQLHPETKNGAQGGRGAKSNESEIFAFSKETAEQIGLSRRSIELAVAIWGRLSDDSRARLPGTPFADHQASLKALADLGDDEQAAVLDILLADAPKAKTVAEALAIAHGKPAESEKDKAFRRALSSFAPLTPTERKSIYRYYETEIRAYAAEQGWL